MEWIYDDGGRSKYFKGEARDCVTRAIAIATNKDYKEIYNMVAKYVEKVTGTKSARNGVPKKVTRKILKDLGFEWKPLMKIGSGCTTHLRKEELPNGTIICKVTSHICCIKDGIIYDTFNPSRGGDRCVYGYWVMED